MLLQYLETFSRGLFLRFPFHDVVRYRLHNQQKRQTKLIRFLEKEARDFPNLALVMTMSYKNKHKSSVE